MSSLPSFTDEEVRAARRQVRQKWRTARKYTVTPEDALILVASSKGNRAINENRVSLLIGQVEKGTFYYNGESVIIDDEYALRDGHHRLLACVKAKIPIEVMIVPGVPHLTEDNVDIQLTMDDGANRTNGQAFNMTQVPNATLAATVTKAVMVNPVDGYKTSSPKISSPDMILYYKVNAEEIQRVVKSVRRLTGAVKIPSAPAAVFLHQCSVNTSFEVMEEFTAAFADTSTGGAVSDGRVQLMRLTGGGESGTRDPAYRLLRFTFDAWQRNLRKVRTSTDKPLPSWT